MASASNHATSSLEPPLPPLPSHPYQIYAPATYSSSNNPGSSYTYYYPGQHAGPATSTAVDGEANKPTHMTVQQTYFVHHHHHHHHSAPLQNVPTAQRRGQALPRRMTKIARKYRPLVWLVLFIPIPPLLSVIYLLIGHGLLRNVLRNSASWNIWRPSLRSSAGAAAIGGLILTLPLFILFFRLLHPSAWPAPGARSVRADFFDDEDSTTPSTTSRFMSRTLYLGCAAIVLCLGAMTAPLGLACLPRERRRDMLTPGRAAVAGIVGGGIFVGAVLGGVFIGLLVYLVGKRLSSEGDDEKI